MQDPRDARDPSATGTIDEDAPVPQDEGPTSRIPEDLDERGRRILAELAHEGEAKVAFQGLRRRLSIHQQSLTRALTRLTDAGLVADEARGYRLTEAGYQAIRGSKTRHGDGASTVAHALLPPGIGEGRVARALEQRWFDGLRWYGIVEAPDETVLVWLTDPGHRLVRLRLHGGSFSLEIASEDAPEDDALRAVGPLLAALGELYGVDDATSSVRALTVSDRPFAA